MQDPRHIETAWGSVVIVRRDGSVSVLHEKGLSAKLELLLQQVALPGGAQPGAE